MNSTYNQGQTPTTPTKSFPVVAQTALHSLQQQIEKKLPNIFFKEGNGYFSFEANGGEYVINRQVPEKQIWVSSPVSGATHFDLTEKGFLHTRDGVGLSEMLRKELDL